MSQPTKEPAFLTDLNRQYERLHTAKEDAYWAAYMGLTDDADAAQKQLDDLDIELKRWMQDPERLAAARSALAADKSGDAEELTALGGWVATLEANVIDNAEARTLSEETVAAEGELALSRGGMKLGYESPRNGFVSANSVKLGAMLRSEKDPALRKAAWQGLRNIEPHVLANGYIEIVKQRNRLGRMLGGEDFYDWTVRRTEGMSKAEIFTLLDELEAKTRDSGRRCIEQLKRTHGAENVTPWNIQYLISGDITAEQDPYFPFAQSLRRWGETFAALGIKYRGAQLVLDLVDRQGKYENGFMHGPVPAWRDRGSWRPARIQFTANAIPGMVGSGHRATETFFHEGGHAAHFANIDMPAPCFALEFAPTSVAFAEVQSMFLDSLIGDADWQTRYARNSAGEPLPAELIRRTITATQPFAAWQIRAMLTVPYAERAIYELPQDDLTPETILRAVRRIESEMTFLDEGGSRPVLSVPHLLAGESSAYYHGYILAEMAVQQTRNFFLGRDGHLVDNPAIGPELARVYWQPGNSFRFVEFIQQLTGRSLSADDLADKVNRSVEETLERAERTVEKLSDIPPGSGPVDLDASIQVMHGNQLTAGGAGVPFEQTAEQFARWIEGLQDR
ncbi:MAG: peptidase M3 [Planctomycetes bacterium]|nr:peptidase M3 [Planctomycetota bacterium]